MRRRAYAFPKGARKAPVGDVRVTTIGRIKFSTYLAAQAGEIRKSRSGEKTALKMMAAGALLLEDVGYRDLNVEEISAAAGSAKGTFYIHFPTKDDFLLELARQYVRFEGQFMPAYDERETVFGATLRSIEWYEGVFSTNIGVLRCIVQMGEVHADMRKIWHDRNTRIVDKLVDAITRRVGSRLPKTEHLMFAVRTAGGMLDQSLFNRFQVLVGTGHTQPYDDETLVRLHAVMVYRAIYGRDPPRKEAADILAMLPSLPKDRE